MTDTSPGKFRDFLLAEWCDTLFLEFRLDKRLVGVAVTDILDQGLSAVYTFFDPLERRRGLGVFAILKQIELARARNLRLLYLGYLIEKCDKMKYKADYRPLEILVDGAWRDFDAWSKANSDTPPSSLRPPR